MPTTPTRRPARPTARRPERRYGFAVGLGLAWVFVVFLYAARILRAGGSVLFWLALSAAVVLLVRMVAEGRTRDSWRTARRASVFGLLMLVPVAFDPKTFDVFNLTKYTVVVIGWLVLAAFLAVEWVRSGRLPIVRTGLQWPVVLLVGLTVLAFVFSSNKRISLLGFYKSYDGLYSVLAFAVIFFAVVEALSSADVRRALQVFFYAGGGVVVLYGMLQLHDRSATWGGKWDWVQWGDASFKGSSIWSTLGNPNHLAGYLAILFPVGVVLLFLARSWWGRGVAALICVGTIFEMIQTTTKGAILGLGLALFVMGILARPEIVRRPWLAPAFAVTVLIVGRVLIQILGAERTRGSFGRLILLFTVPGIVAAAAGAALLAGLMVLGDRMRRPWLPLGLAATALVVATIGVGVASPTTGYKALDTVFDLDSNSTGRQRVELWKSAIDMAADQPLLGFGPDTFRIPFGSYQTSRFVQLYGPDQIANGPHNAFMNVVATAGVPALLAFIGLLFFVALHVAGAWRRLFQVEQEGRATDQKPARDQRMVLIGVVGAVVAYLGQASFNVQQIGLSFCFWAFLGLIAVIALDAGVPVSLRPATILGRPGIPDDPDRRSLGAAAKRNPSRTRRPPAKKTTRPAPAQKGTSASPKAPPTATPPPTRARPEPRGTGRRRPPQRGGRVLGAAVVSFGVAGVLGFLASGPYRGDHSYRLALIEQNRYQSLAQSEQGKAQAPEYLLRAQREFGNAIAANPWEAVYAEGRGRMLAAQGQPLIPRQDNPGNRVEALKFYREAIADYEHAVSLQPRNPYILGAYADVLLKIQELDTTDTTSRAKAIDALRTAAEANPFRPQTVLLLAQLLLNQGDNAGALAVVERSLTTLPTNTDLLRTAAQIADQLGDKDKARQYWERLVALNPSDEAAHRALGLPAIPKETTTATASGG